MARTAGQMPQRLPMFEIGAPFRAAGSLWPARVPVGANSGEDGDLTVLAVAYAGLAALLALPILLIGSMAVGVAMAPPAAIALGYLAASYALASNDERSAASISAIVLGGLVLWSVSPLLLDGEPSRMGLTAALLAPAFAAAPALARFILTRRADPAIRTALRNAGCLDHLAPDEAVLVVRRSGALLAATRAAREKLRLSDDEIGSDAGRFFRVVDRPKLLDAIVRCMPGHGPVELTLHDESGSKGSSACAYAARVTADAGGAVCIRLAALPIGDGEPAASPVGTSTPRQADPDCDVGEAVAFAARRSEQQVRATGAILISSVEPGTAAKCERQTCRRILLLMIESVLARCDAGDALHLTARTVRGVVLLRITGRPRSDLSSNAAGTEGEGGLIALRELTEHTGGTAVMELTAAEMRLSVRLDMASPAAGAEA